ncbi:ATP-binding protein [Candidatus Woesearchaeota archaeon]|nr:ATP-binding protein [Candidatus Woesearchaeota archaeon]
MSLEIIVSKEITTNGGIPRYRQKLYVDACEAKEWVVKKLDLKYKLATGYSIENTKILLDAGYWYVENAADSIKTRIEEDANFVGKLKLLAQLHADSVRLEVEDNGTGIDPEVEPLLFISRIESAKFGKLNMHGGLGVSLYWLSNKLEKIGGRVGYVNKGQGVGAAFWCEVPLTRKS